MVVSDDDNDMVQMVPFCHARVVQESDWLPTPPELEGWTFRGRMDGENTSYLQIDFIAGTMPRLHFYLQSSRGGRQPTPLIQAFGLATTYDSDRFVVIPKSL